MYAIACLQQEEGQLYINIHNIVNLRFLVVVHVNKYAGIQKKYSELLRACYSKIKNHRRKWDMMGLWKVYGCVVSIRNK